jgi:O-antigen ligase
MAFARPIDGPPAVFPLLRASDPRLARLLEYGREKDPRGHVVHAWITGLAFGLQPLTPVAAWIGLVILLGYAVLRLHATWRCLPSLLRMPLMVAWIAMSIWSLLAISWSSDPAEGFENAGVLRTIVLITATWPILDRWRPILFGMAAGSAVQMVFQLLMYVGVMENFNQTHSAWTMTGGFSKHTGNTAVWASVSTCLMFGIAVRRIRGRYWAMVLGVCCVVGVILSGSRTLLMAIPIVIALQLLLSVHHAASRRVKLITLGGLILGFLGMLALPSVAPSSLPVKRLSAMVSELEKALVDQNYNSSSGLRLFWWRESVEMVARNPVVGHGSGSFRVEFEKHLDQHDQHDQQNRQDVSFFPKRAYCDNPHSTIALEMVERGAVGLLLWGSIFVLGIHGAWRAWKQNPALSGLLFGWLVLFIYGISNSLQLSGFTVSLAAVLLALSMPRPQSLNVET